MKSTQYSDKVLDHFKNPRNVGTLEGDDVTVGKVGNPVCGDLMEFYIKVQDGKIADIKFKTFGCGSAIATASMITELAKGKTVDAALKITRQDVANELESLQLSRSRQNFPSRFPKLWKIRNKSILAISDGTVYPSEILI